MTGDQLESSVSCKLFRGSVTPPIAFLTEHYENRRIPLIVGQTALIGAQIMLMEAPAYWLMVVARITQGISSAVVWTVALALLYAIHHLGVSS